MHAFDLARSQDGAIARQQLLSAGISADAIDGLVRRGELVALYGTVYRHRSCPPTFRQTLWAAALWSGGVVSHRSAAALWELDVKPSLTAHVTVADRRFRGECRAVRVHRVRLARYDCSSIAGLPVTSRSRTIIDLLRTEPRSMAVTLCDRAVQVGLLSLRDLSASVNEQPGRTGNSQLRELIERAEPGAHAESERILHRLLRRAGLRGWRAQYRIRIHGRTIMADVAFPEWLLVIEVDGRRYHDEFSDRFEDDRVRQNLLVAGGWRVLRFTWRRLNDEPGAVLDEIVQLLAA